MRRNERGSDDLRGDVGVPPQTPAGDKSPAPLYWGFAPKDYVFVGFSLLWLCVPIWGYAPKPHASSLSTDK